MDRSMLIALLGGAIQGFEDMRDLGTPGAAGFPQPLGPLPSTQGAPNIRRCWGSMGNWCDCGRKISANKRKCLACARAAGDVK